MNASQPLQDLKVAFRQGSTTSMPIAGTIYWFVVALASLWVKPGLVAQIVLFGSGMIFPFAMLIDKVRGENKIVMSKTPDPLTSLFLRGLVFVVAMWPLVIIAAQVAKDPNLIVLGGAILMALVWIPFGWASDDPVGMEHAIGRTVASYVAYLLAPPPYQATAIAIIVMLAYAYSFVRMRRD